MHLINEYRSDDGNVLVRGSGKVLEWERMVQRSWMLLIQSKMHNILRKMQTMNHLDVLREHRPLPNARIAEWFLQCNREDPDRDPERTPGPGQWRGSSPKCNLLVTRLHPSHRRRVSGAWGGLAPAWWLIPPISPAKYGCHRKCQVAP